VAILWSRRRKAASPRFHNTCIPFEPGVREKALDIFSSVTALFRFSGLRKTIESSLELEPVEAFQDRLIFLLGEKVLLLLGVQIRVL
jgi:hypothetical protein